MEELIKKMENGNSVPQSELQKVAYKLVRFFKKNGFLDVSQDTRKNSTRYISIRIKGNVPDTILIEASKIFPSTKVYVIPPDGVNRNNFYTYFYV